MDFTSDPIGYAIWDFTHNNTSENIIVQSDICDDDILAISYLFRRYEDMPELEKFALSKAKGNILDIGGGSGCHSSYLQDNGCEITAIDSSKYAVQHMKSKGINAIHSKIENFKSMQFDTLFLLMNGLGLAGRKSNLNSFLIHLKSLISPEGKIICDSSDISFLYTDEDGGKWMDLNSDYFGEMKFNMVYKEVESGWFDWIYIDRETLTKHCKNVGLKCEIIFEGDNDHYLAELKHL